MEGPSLVMGMNVMRGRLEADASSLSDDDLDKVETNLQAMMVAVGDEKDGRA